MNSEKFSFDNFSDHDLRTDSHKKEIKYREHENASSHAFKCISFYENCKEIIYRRLKIFSWDLNPSLW